MNEIRIKRVKNEQDRNVLARLYSDYLKSLSDFSPDVEEALFRGEGAILACKNSAERRDRKDYLVIADEYNVIGFVMLGEYPNSLSRHDIYVQEFFIKEKYRRQGVGTEVVKKLLEKETKDVSLYILKRNYPAVGFWTEIMTKLGYEDRSALGNIGYIEKNGLLHWRYYVKKQVKNGK